MSYREAGAKLNQNMTNHQQAIAECRAALEAAEIFLLKYESKLPEGLGSLYVGGFGAHFDVGLMHRNDEERNKALAYMGDTFGRSGWEAKLVTGYSQFDGFNWTKEVDGVRVKIEGAQKLDQPKSFPVDPKQFPIQLEDAP